MVPPGTDLVDGDVVLAHAWLRPVSSGFHFARLRGPEDTLAMLATASFRVAFVGHSHQPGWWQQAGESVTCHAAAPGQRLDWEPGVRYIVDVGSLGEPQLATDPTWLSWDDHGVIWQ